MFDLGESGAKIAVSVLSTLLATCIVSTFSWLILKTRFNKKFRQALQHLRMAEALQKERQYSQAKDEVVKTVSLLSDDQRSSLLSQAYMRLGDISMSLREWDEAIQSYIVCREITAVGVRMNVSLRRAPPCVMRALGEDIGV